MFYLLDSFRKQLNQRFLKNYGTCPNTHRQSVVLCGHWVYISEPSRETGIPQKECAEECTVEQAETPCRHDSPIF